jgi:hypothetical protein
MKTDRLLYFGLGILLFLLPETALLYGDSTASADLGELRHYVCLASFSLPANAARFRLELAESGVETITEEVRVNRRLYTRVLYREPFVEFQDARNLLESFRTHRVLVENSVTSLWIRSGAPIEVPASDSLLAAQREQEQPKRPSPVDSPRVERPSPAPPSQPPSVREEASAPPISAENPEPVAPAAAKPPTTVLAKAPATEPAKTSELSEASSGEPSTAELLPDPNNPYKLLHPEGYANAVFATEPIGLGEEDTHDLKERFIYPRPVFARCYLPGPIGEISGEDFWHEIWINGKLRGRTFFKEPPEPSWDQIQIWVTEDEYRSQMDDLGSGEHSIILWVMKNEYQGERAVAGENAAGEIVAEMKEIWVPVRLSKGSFTYVKP